MEKAGRPDAEATQRNGCCGGVHHAWLSREPLEPLALACAKLDVDAFFCRCLSRAQDGAVVCIGV